MTPDQMVDSVIGSAALEGYTTSPEEREALMGIATGALDAGRVVRALVEQARREAAS